MSEPLIVISSAAFESICEIGKFDELASWLKTKEPVTSKFGLALVQLDNFRFLVTGTDTAGSRVAVIRPNNTLWELTDKQWETLLDRCRGFVERASHIPLILPPNWRSYIAGNLVAFAALKKNQSASNPRWNVQFDPSDTIIFWDLYPTAKGAFARLEDQQVDDSLGPRIRSLLPRVIDRSREILGNKRSMSHDSAVSLGPRIDGSGTRRRSFVEWMDAGTLTKDQMDFILSESKTRLKGPAGSGKTLTLELKALHVVQKMVKDGEEPRVLFATHNWASTAQVDEDFRILDTLGLKDFITTAPLVQVIEEIRSLESDLRLLGSDAEEDNLFQLLVLKDAVTKFRNEEFLRYEMGCSDLIREGIRSVGTGIRDSEAFENDLLSEFAVVLGGEGIQLYDAERKRYLQLERQKRWLQLNEVDKNCIFQIYAQFLTILQAQNLLTSDQFLLDRAQWFKGFEWGPLRKAKGYNAIFVDELHSFRPVEREVLNHLSRDSSNYPPIFTSVDPKQSPTGRYGSYVEDRAIFAEQDEVELKTIHRYTPEILGLVKHIDRMVPAEDFGSMWRVDLASSQSLREPGERPVVIDCKQALDRLAVFTLNEANKKASISGSLGIVVMSEHRINEFIKVAENLPKHRNVTIVRSRDDLGITNSRRNRLVVGSPEMLAGLQFDSVIVSGFSDVSVYERTDTKRIHFLSNLYLAVSRAIDDLMIVIDSGDDGIPEVLWQAKERGLVNWKDA